MSTYSRPWTLLSCTQGLDYLNSDSICILWLNSTRALSPSYDHIFLNQVFIPTHQQKYKQLRHKYSPGVPVAQKEILSLDGKVLHNQTSLHRQYRAVKDDRPATRTLSFQNVILFLVRMCRNHVILIYWGRLPFKEKENNYKRYRTRIKRTPDGLSTKLLDEAEDKWQLKRHIQTKTNLTA